jgi:hypothetical protein
VGVDVGRDAGAGVGVGVEGGGVDTAAEGWAAFVIAGLEAGCEGLSEIRGRLGSCRCSASLGRLGTVDLGWG